jgi:hypothetical protein
VKVEFRDPQTRQIAAFLTGIGLVISAAALTDDTFLPGICIANGNILVDADKLAYAGDLLHEAGHLAVAAPELRATLGGELTFPGEIMEPIEAQAMAWSYAAALHLELDPSIVFHQGGYGGQAERLLLNFSLGVYIGVNGLEQAGLTVTGQRAADLGLSPYPKMIKWLRD